MAFGPGKYDHLCTHVRIKTKAELVIVAVVGGTRGSGFSCQIRASHDGKDERALAITTAKMLRDMAEQIEADALEPQRAQPPTRAGN